MNRIVVLMIGALLTAGALAKLPEMTEEQKAAAAEKKAKAAEGDKKAAGLLAASQDAVAGKYIERMRAQGITVTPTLVAPPAAPPAQPAAAPAAK
ncbi:formate dehydrogenase [Methyloversatilis sp. XJ19-49]|uniref:formate dehydrogenase n=1 Tax=Methyloversatilis sp. XJ19-49 TaxID=2963429 RepID=UPI00211CF40F|nr:formate dehydrogenase [Methyloversatilis sp. XJ19-49]MCQ9377656.1 formate dehydrogenase [Methyloversatilis sp. XJ19-49]